MRRHQRQNHLLSALRRLNEANIIEIAVIRGSKEEAIALPNIRYTDSIYRLTKRPANSSEWRCFPNRDRRHYGIVPPVARTVQSLRLSRSPQRQ